MNFDGWSDHEGKPVTRETIAAGVDFMLGDRRQSVDAQTRERIIDYAMAHDAFAMHAIAAVLGTCCHCVDCLNKDKAPRQ